MDWLQAHLPVIEGFPRPDWQAIYQHVEQEFSNVDQHALWNDITKSWLQLLVKTMGEGFTIHESDNFLLVTSEDKKYVKKFLTFLEASLKKIRNVLPQLAMPKKLGRFVVLIFDDHDQYYSYLSYFYSTDGTYGLSAGVFIPRGYGHFAFPQTKLAYAERVAAHELTHALLAHLPLPRWLNEGIAVNIENLLTDIRPLRMDKEIIQKHRKFWTTENIQEFWSGRAFHRADEAQELSYHLAEFAVSTLSQDYKPFREFTLKAHYRDGGESAANEVYDGSLGGLFYNLLGEDYWSPDPELWQERKNKSENKTEKGAG